MEEKETTIEEIKQLPPRQKRKYVHRLRADRAASEISLRKEKYAHLRILGCKPTEAVETMDAEDGRIRAKSARYSEACTLERQTEEIRMERAIPTDMNGAEWERWKGEMHLRMANRPKEFNTVALAAVEALDKQRKEKQYATTEATIATLEASFAEIERLADPKVWTHPKKGPLVHREAEPAGNEASPALDGLGSGNTPAAILGVLRGFLAGEEKVHKKLEELVSNLSETGETAQVCS